MFLIPLYPNRVNREPLILDVSANIANDWRTFDRTRQIPKPQKERSQGYQEPRMHFFGGL